MTSTNQTRPRAATRRLERRRPPARARRDRAERDPSAPESPAAAPASSPAVEGAAPPALGALRWAALGVGAVAAAGDLARGEPGVVVALAVVIALTAWRTGRSDPGDGERHRNGLAALEMAVVSGALGLSGGLLSPFLPVLVVVLATIALRHGPQLGLLAAAAGATGATGLAALSAAPGPPVVLSATVLGVAALAPALAAGHRSPGGAGQPDLVSAEIARLRHANRLLTTLLDLARNLPTNLDLEEVVVAIRAQLAARFDAARVVILSHDDGRWQLHLADGVDVGSSRLLDQLPPPLDLALLTLDVLRIDDLSAVCERTGSGLYARLIVDGFEQGLLAVEHPRPGYYDTAAVELFEGFAEVVALSLENARAFGQLRSLAAAEERSRIARDLHDRLGQWLTYINLELERVNTNREEPIPELDRLQDDVRSAIDELRDALVELRTRTRAERPLTVVLREVVDRFTERTGLTLELTVPDDPSKRLGGVTEDELLRIVQESLTNIEKHADATVVHVNWSVEGGRGILTIEDNGRGFDPGRGARSTAYGLVGMRERAAAVGAILEITSQRGIGTVITVLVGASEENRT